ncbi:molybdenum cofactor guanylyltransferase [Belliella kenyensis]|uniref:Probable molybdenum cofactor guanylyltransferase n=1 Tax=Belliella kenyensis TaxID=1472724 RepID=A0ABV8EMJ0_9BACT|nr:molybdenum cofactor guanylyltransferase [Belliella kenyensis]MCH7400823.1 molybdenum cofactor guanylyltransferase [Belliella kenyensis]MDN3601889.1 molybdenum cofactor guanylyltransferase [Belliella kenyensis]
MKPKNIEAFILAGGKSSRMGQDKGLVKVLGKAMIQHLIEKLNHLHIPCSIVSDNVNYKPFERPCFKDIVENRGPLGGLFTALTFAQKKHILLLSCDTPLIPIQALTYLLDKSLEQQINVSSIAGRYNPLFAIYPTSVLDLIVTCLRGNKLKMQDFIKKSIHQEIPLDQLVAPSPFLFTNFNSKEDLEIIPFGLIL